MTRERLHDFLCFEADTIRTCDLQIRNLMLYPTELQPLARQKSRRSRGDLGFSRKRPCLLLHPRLRAPGASCAAPCLSGPTPWHIYRSAPVQIPKVLRLTASFPKIKDFSPVNISRSRGDLNPRYPVRVRRFSKPLVSTAHPPLLKVVITVTYNDFLC